MNKEVLIIFADLRRGGNSEILAKEFEKCELKVGNGIMFPLRDRKSGSAGVCFVCLKP